MWVKILSGNRAGRMEEMPRAAAENAVATGFAAWATRADIDRLNTTAAPAAGASLADQPSPSLMEKGPGDEAPAPAMPAAPESSEAPARDPSAGRLSAVHIKFGRWIVRDQSGHALNDEPLTKEQAAAWATTGRDPRTKR